jgi:hypothetical protein
MQKELYLEFLKDVAEKGSVQEAAKGWEVNCNSGWLSYGKSDKDIPGFFDGYAYRRKPKPHPHAELMAEFVKDALETSEPWERWEYREKNSTIWNKLSYMPCWVVSMDYRRIPR